MLGSVDSRGLARRGALTALLAAGGLGVHLTVQRLAPPPIYRAGAGLVEVLPFLPWTVWIYLLFFPLLVATGALQSAGRWPRLIGAWATASVATWALVLLVPVTFPRPDLATLDPLHAWVFGLVYGLDSAHVTFPCLHSATTWISWFALRDRGPALRYLLFVFAAAITVSTMTTRQHLVTDNLAGLAIAWACAWVFLSRTGRAPAEAAQPEERNASPGSRS